jgi:hypothetical protein
LVTVIGPVGEDVADVDVPVRLVRLPVVDVDKVLVLVLIVLVLVGTVLVLVVTVPVEVELVGTGAEVLSIYMFSLSDPPQYSKALPVHVMSQLLTVGTLLDWFTEPALIVFPQKHYQISF